MLIAITGGIGCGKSVVSELLRVMGFPVYDCDAKAKSLMVTDYVLRQELIDIFGTETYLTDGTLNKPHLSKAIFTSPDLLAKMNAAVHPAVSKDIYKTMKVYYKKCPENKKFFFYESAILFESQFNKIAVPDVVVSVSAPLELRIDRTMARDKATREVVISRINSQMSQEEKDSLADYVIKNDDKNFVIAQVVDLLLKIQK